jgi:fatty-acyl-CoA synthase
VEVRDGEPFDEATLREHVKAHLAGYKVPKCVVATERMFRAPNGKADYKRARAHVMSAMGIEDA